MAGLLPVPIGILTLAAARPFNVDRTKTPPYVAGYSNDARTMYLHNAFPGAMNVNGKVIDPAPFVLLHEAIEKAKLDQSHAERGEPVKYKTAHSNYATPAEHAALKHHAGFTPKDIRTYDAKMKAVAMRLARMPNNRVPSRMDMAPYRDTGKMGAVAPHKQVRG